ncbi:MAG: Uma2 family endonuclease [candidate division KSB1 bacterium]
MTMLLDFTSPGYAFAPTGHKWPPQGQWTYEDYCRLPEDGWIYEVLEGELHMSPAPLTRHQKIILNLSATFWTYNNQHQFGEVLIAPTDVILPGLTSPVQPDIVVVLQHHLAIVKDERIEGAPDLVVEILSPWNWNVDRQKKFKIYAKAGVPEYWIVDAEKRTIELYVLRGDAYHLLGNYGVGECVRSEVVIGFEVKVEEICRA